MARNFDFKFPVQKMLVKYIDNKEHHIGFFTVDEDYLFFACHVDAMDGELLNGFYEALRMNGQVIVAMSFEDDLIDALEDY